MGWSEAARKAALEARKMHKVAKKSVDRLNLGNAHAPKEIRKGYAAKVRAVRAGKITGSDAQSVMRYAALSTYQRNAGRSFRDAVVSGRYKLAPAPFRPPNPTGRRYSK